MFSPFLFFLVGAIAAFVLLHTPPQSNVGDTGKVTYFRVSLGSSFSSLGSVSFSSIIFRM